MDIIRRILSVRIQSIYLFFKRKITFSQMLIALSSSPTEEEGCVVTLFGNKFFVSGGIRDFIACFWQIVERNQYHIELIKDGDVVVDAGANMGVFSVLVASRYPHATVYAFEPTPSVFELLKENAKQYPNIKVFHLALGDVEKASTIVETGYSGGGNYIGEGGSPVMIRTIDSFHMEVNFLKMDTEGYEANILKGAKATIQRDRPVIAMSAYHKPDDKIELPKTLNDIAGYNCELHRDSEEDFICIPK